MPNQSNVEEALSFPIYHGTSSFFADSIVKEGLGARNVVAEMNALEFLAKARGVCKEVMDLDSDLKLSEYVLMSDAMIAQKVTPGRMNFRHGSAYLTPAVTQAALYATMHCVGSELISRCVYLYQKLTAHDAAQKTQHAQKVSVTSPGIAALNPAKCFPVVIKASNVLKSAVAGESDQDIEALIRYVETNLKEPELFEIMTCQSNFRLINPVMPDQLETFRIVEFQRDATPRTVKLEPFKT